MPKKWFIVVILCCTISIVCSMDVLIPNDDNHPTAPPSKVTIASICRHPERLASLTSDTAVMHKLGVYCDSLDLKQVPDVKAQFIASMESLNNLQRTALSASIGRVMDLCFPPRTIPELADQLLRLKRLSSNSKFFENFGKYCSGIDTEMKPEMKELLLSSFGKLTPLQQRSLNIPFEEIVQVCFPPSFMQILAKQFRETSASAPAMFGSALQMAIENIRQLNNFVLMKPFMNLLKEECQRFSPEQLMERRMDFNIAKRTLSREESSYLQIAIQRVQRTCFPYVERLASLEMNMKRQLFSESLDIGELYQLSHLDEDIHQMMHEWSLKQLLEHSISGTIGDLQTVISLCSAKCRLMRESEIIRQIYPVEKSELIWRVITEGIAPRFFSESELRRGTTARDLALLLQSAPGSTESVQQLETEGQRKAFKHICLERSIPHIVSLVEDQEFDLVSVLASLKIPFFNWTPLMIAFLIGPNVFNILLQQFSWDSIDTQGNNILHALSSYSNPPFNDFVLTAFKQVVAVAGPKGIESRNYDGETPLFRATKFLRSQPLVAESLVLYLINQAHANVKAENREGFTPLYRAIEAQNENVFNAIIAKLDDLSDIPEQRHFDYLFQAFVSDNAGFMRKLLEKGLDSNTQNPDGRHETVLYHVIFHRRLEMADILIKEFGAHLTIPNSSNETPLDLVRSRWRSDPEFTKYIEDLAAQESSSLG